MKIVPYHPARFTALYNEHTATLHFQHAPPGFLYLMQYLGTANHYLPSGAYALVFIQCRPQLVFSSEIVGNQKRGFGVSNCIVKFTCGNAAARRPMLLWFCRLLNKIAEEENIEMAFLTPTGDPVQDVLLDEPLEPKNIHNVIHSHCPTGYENTPPRPVKSEGKSLDELVAMIRELRDNDLGRELIKQAAHELWEDD